MNLCNDKWIPVVDMAGLSKLVSLTDVFAEGAGLRDLAVRPHERVALMRLLICIAQAALDGPASSREWEAAGGRLPAAAPTYLVRWHDSFELFHSEKPFLQFPGLEKPPKLAKKPGAKPAVDEPAEGTPVTKLDFALATGNNTTLFDHGAATEVPRVFTPAEMALMLVTFQCFSPGGRIGVARWRGRDTPGAGSSGHAPCAPSAMLHAIIRRGSLVETIQANLLTRRTVETHYGHPWGRPVWESMPGSFADEPAISNATGSYLGRLMPLSRAILLRPGGSDLLLANGLDYATPPEFSPEPTASVVKRSDGKGTALVGAGNKAIWRELPALVARRLADEPGGALALTQIDNNQPFDLWVGALITDKASILDTVEGSYAIPARMLNEDGRRFYEDGVRQAESVASGLRDGCKAYRQSLELHPQGYPEAGRAARQFWTSVEQQRGRLLEAVSAPEGEADPTIRVWQAVIHGVARSAYAQCCPDETPRQIRAHAVGLRVLLARLRTDFKASHPVPQPG